MSAAALSADPPFTFQYDAFAEYSSVPSIGNVGCTTILDAFAEFANADYSPYTFDVFLENAPNQKHVRERMRNFLQKWLVEEFFDMCMEHRNCPLRIHWTDPTLDDPFITTTPDAMLANANVTDTAFFQELPICKGVGQSQRDDGSLA